MGKRTVFTRSSTERKDLDVVQVFVDMAPISRRPSACGWTCPSTPNRPPTNTSSAHREQPRRQDNGTLYYYEGWRAAGGLLEEATNRMNTQATAGSKKKNERNKGRKPGEVPHPRARRRRTAGCFHSSLPG